MGREQQVHGTTMPPLRRAAATLALMVWLCLAMLFMILARYLDLEVYFVLFLVGTLIVTELSDTRYLVPRERRQVGYLMGAGVVLFGFIVANKIVEILTS